MHVPSNWQLHGFGFPIYVTSHLPFVDTPPLILGPKGNESPVGTYKRHFTLPDKWRDFVAQGWQVLALLSVALHPLSPHQSNISPVTLPP